ncbi:unnamed protein product [Bursaphelenchus xylophilus]|uniref:(pine wood nematode) hypothetical protein n=1 Tax=Bursaphelenchus xylophilus TaxID=6326 RepID=A0A1I7S8W1_BURXY|nr:unnamed protein product [Bursaphelenchus xylophilus]CAG9085931.1 unnamed protein product [Bursaphelenchus xylophilus]
MILNRLRVGRLVADRRFFSFNLALRQQDERPQMYQLEYIQTRVAESGPLMFRQKMDYTFYREDVILEDDIFNVKKEGRQQMMHYFGMITVAGQILFPYIEFESLNIIPLLDDGTVRYRWRVKYLNWIQTLNVKNFNPAIRDKNAKWFDGYSTFFVDGNGKVFKLKLQKVMPDDNYMQTSKRIAQKFAQISTNQNPSLNSTAKH